MTPVDIHSPWAQRNIAAVGRQWWHPKTLSKHVPHYLFVPKGKKRGRLLQPPKEVQRPEVFTARVWLPTWALRKFRVVWSQLHANQLICTESTCFMHLPLFLYFFITCHLPWTFCSLGKTTEQGPLQAQQVWRYQGPAGSWCVSCSTSSIAIWAARFFITKLMYEIWNKYLFLF